MFKKRMWIGIILSIIFLVFSINGSTAYYKYTQESGTNFYVGTDDKADALEDTNEMRQILDDLGALVVHSKRNDLYPKDGSTGGTLAIPNSALVSFATGTKGDLFYCSATNVWTKLNIGTDNQILVVATDLPNWETPSSDLLSDVASIAMLDEAETIAGNWINTTHPWADDEIADDITCTSYYLKTEIDTLSKIETIYSKNIIDSDELAALDYKSKNYYSALGSDQTYSDNADTDSQPVGEAVVFGDLLYPDWTAGEWLKADADLAAKMPGLRIALESKTDGQTCLMLVKGYIRDDSAFEFTASMVYTSVTPGAMSSTAPTESGDQLQRVGVAKSADILFFDPSIDVGEIKP